MKGLGYALGIDVGGTFTDLALIRLSDGQPFYHKTPSSPDDPSRAVRRGIDELLRLTQIAPDTVRYFGHGTTVATNAVIVGRMAATGLITTSGFEDVLEIRRQRQPHNYDIRRPKPLPPVPRHLRKGVNERTYLMGAPNTPPNMTEVDQIIEVFRDSGVEAIAVCFLHSYLNPSHERIVAEWVKRQLPDTFVCTSHEVLAEFREYERVSTTTLNAALGPIMQGYLGRIEQRAAELRLATRPLIMQSNGGVASAHEAGSRPVGTLASGPAAGVIGAIQLSKRASVLDLITFDVGGTSTDVCLIRGGSALVAREREFAGYPVRFPMIDIHSVGAGGGSIAWVDAGGFLQVGPRSAGAVPGPACYGTGGMEPTVTDANVVLGRLNPETLLGGRMQIRADLARAVIEKMVGSVLKLNVEQAAHAILTILNENLVQAIRVVTVERGFDPRNLVLVAFGGAGPLLASQLARELGIGQVLVPKRPGLLCALGLLVADMQSDFSLTRIMRLGSESNGEVNRAFAELEHNATQWFERERIPTKGRVLRRGMDLRYQGQSHELTVSVGSGGKRGGVSLARLEADFRAEHQRVYGYAPNAPIELVTFRLTAVAKVARLARERGSAATTGARHVIPVGSRPVHFEQFGRFVDCPVYERDHLSIHAVITGPAIIEQMDSTTIVFPEQTARSDGDGNLLLNFHAARQRKTNVQPSKSESRRKSAKQGGLTQKRQVRKG